METYINHNDYEEDKKHNTNTGKSSSAKMWSNSYNVFSMWTKFRCFGINPLNGEKVKDDDLINNIRISRCLFYVNDVLNDIVPITSFVSFNIISNVARVFSFIFVLPYLFCQDRVSISLLITG